MIEDAGRVYEPFTEVFYAFWGEDVVVPLPRELSLDETLGSQRLHNLDDFKVGNIEIDMLRSVVILRGNKSTV